MKEGAVDPFNDWHFNAAGYLNRWQQMRQSISHLMSIFPSYCGNVLFDMQTYVTPWLKNTGVVYSPPYHCPYNPSKLKAALKGYVPVLTHYSEVHDFMHSLNL